MPSFHAVSVHNLYDEMGVQNKEDAMVKITAKMNPKSIASLSKLAESHLEVRKVCSVTYFDVLARIRPKPAGTGSN